MQTSFHHQPEAQHPKSPAIYTPAGRLPHLMAYSAATQPASPLLLAQEGDLGLRADAEPGGEEAVSSLFDAHDDRTWIYLLRLTAFILLLVAIIRKNLNTSNQ